MGTHRTVVATAATAPQKRTPSRATSGSTERHRLCAQKRHPVGDAAATDGLWQWDDLLAALTGVAAGRRVAETPPRAVKPTRRSRANRGKSGTKRHVVVERHGIPLAVTLSAANVNDCQMLEPPATPTGEVAWRQRLRLWREAAGVARARDRIEGAPGATSLGGGAHARVAEPVSPPEDSLRTGRRSASGFPRTRVCIDLLEVPLTRFC